MFVEHGRSPAAVGSSSAAVSASASQPLPFVRDTVRQLLTSSQAYHSLPPDEQRRMARAMVEVCSTAATLVAEEMASDAEVGDVAAMATSQSDLNSLHDEDRSTTRRRHARLVDRDAPAHDVRLNEPSDDDAAMLSSAQAAGGDFSGVAADRVASTTKQILNAVSFPRFVTELINGVFKAIVDSSQQQMHSYVELLNNVSSSLTGFADNNVGPDGARQWLVQQFPQFELVDQQGGSQGTDDWGGDDDWGDSASGPRFVVRLRSGATKPSDDSLRAAFGLEPNESVPSGDPDEVLVPFARRALAKQRQGMLATMVMMGMQRIVVESGRLNASMKFHVDTRSAAYADEGSTFDARHTSTAKGKFGMGPWGASATMKNTIGYVSTQKSQTTEEMNTDLELDSGVELYFKTDYLPMEMLAGNKKIDRIKAQTLNPNATYAASETARTERRKIQKASDKQRSSDLDKALKRQTATAPKPDPPKKKAPAPKPVAKQPAATPAPKTKTPAPKSKQNPVAAPKSKSKQKVASAKK